MGDLQLKIGCFRYETTAALFDSSVTVEGADVAVQVAEPFRDKPSEDLKHDKDSECQAVGAGLDEPDPSCQHPAYYKYVAQWLASSRCR